MSSLVEVADEVFVLRHPALDVNVTVVPGEAATLVVDTLSNPAQATELAEQILAISGAPLIVVNTHFHFDHCFGNSVLASGGRPVWAHQNTVAELRDRGAHWQRLWYEQWQVSDPALAEGVAATTILVPDHPVPHESTVDLGGRVVVLRYYGRGHTDGDLTVLVPDADVVVAGDLVEQGGPPDFADGYPLEWPDTVAAMLRDIGPDTVVVPGHGAPVDHRFVTAQHAELARLDWLIRDGNADDADVEQVAARAPFGASAALVAVRRGYAQLSGRG